MIEDTEKSGDARALVKGILDRKEKLLGFGHRVYRAEDPRARVLRATAQPLNAPATRPPPPSNRPPSPNCANAAPTGPSKPTSR